MSWIRQSLLFVCGCAAPAAVFAVGYTAQQGPARQPPAVPVFNTLFPHPTGNNGYEEFARAEDLFTSSPAFAESERLYDDRGADHIEAERRLILDPTVRTVLSLIRAGMRKPIRSPRPAPELNTLIPELRDLRAIARLMCAEMDVLIADGRMPDAIACLDDALNFGSDLQVGTMMSGVVGLYIENTVLREFSEHIDTLSASDCERLGEVARRHLSRRDPQISLLAAEREMFLRTLRSHVTDASALLDTLDPGPHTPKPIRQGFTEVCSIAKANPAAGAAMLDAAASLVSAHFADLIREVKRPPWKRRFHEPTELSSPESKLFYSLFPAGYIRLSDRFAAERLTVQMLAVEASVVHDLRQSGRLPGTLAELKLGTLVIDPFSGAQLGYEKGSGESFTLKSAGPWDAGDSNHAPTGLRTPVLVEYPQVHR